MRGLLGIGHGPIGPHPVFRGCVRSIRDRAHAGTSTTSSGTGFGSPVLRGSDQLVIRPFCKTCIVWCARIRTDASPLFGGAHKPFDGSDMDSSSLRPEVRRQFALAQLICKGLTLPYSA